MLSKDLLFFLLKTTENILKGIHWWCDLRKANPFSITSKIFHQNNLLLRQWGGLCQYYRLGRDWKLWISYWDILSMPKNHSYTQTQAYKDKHTDELYGLHHFRDGLKCNTPTTSRNKKKHRLLESIQFDHNLSAIFCWLENFCLFDLCSIKINEPIIKLFDRSHWRRQSNKSH